MSKSRLGFTCLAGLIAALSLGSVPAVAQSSMFSVRDNVAYGPLSAERGDLFLPLAGTALRPAVVVIHGGGWINGQRSQDAWLSELLARKGMVVFNVDYRLGRADEPNTHWPAQLVDVQLAVRWLRSQAHDLRIAPDRIGAIGDSAGGTLAVFLGVLTRPVAGDQAGLLADQRCDVKAVVDQFGVMNLQALGDSASVMVEGMFGNKTPGGDLIQSVSPLPFVSRHTAPMLLVHGDKDAFVPPEQSRQLFEALQAHGVATQFISFHGGHGFEDVSSQDLLALFNQDASWLSQQLSR